MLQRREKGTDLCEREKGTDLFFEGIPGTVYLITEKRNASGACSLATKSENG